LFPRWDPEMAQQNPELKPIEFSEKHLKGNSFFLGNTYTLADVIFTVVLLKFIC
jgi:glutathione S-transferase